MVITFGIITTNAKKKGVKMPETKAISCPNCGKPAIKSDNEISCEHCDATFVFTKKVGIQLKEFGKFEDHENRLKKLEDAASSTAQQKTETTEEEEDI